MTAVGPWHAAVDLGARGRYDDAEALVTPLIATRDRWASLSLSMLASHRRQIGDRDSALRMDAEALSTAADPESRADALTGLAADAVASGDADRAALWHADAAAHASATWRTVTRWHWVAAERALLVDDRRLSVEHAREALAACTGRSGRHEAKSRIILAASTGEAGDLIEVGHALREGGWITLAWPLALVAADHRGALPASWLTQAWETGREATYAIERGLAEALIPLWRAHPGVRRLREQIP